ncbi:hypothetical protein [Streptomyces sp. NPDC048462]|uniref:hypothetical protein n=1 Tax=Streptomyces sp. NPDC048462 TaxID=3365555 RepID=UPI003711223B
MTTGMHEYDHERLPLLTLEEAHDVIDVLVQCGNDEAGRLARDLAARVPSREGDQLSGASSY